MRIFFRHMLDKGCWKFSGRTNKHITNYQRLWLALSQLVAALVTFATLGNVTCWADIFIGLEYVRNSRKKMAGKL